MIDFANRRFTIRIGRASKPLKTGERIARRTSTVGRKTSTRRLSVRNSAALKRAPSGAGGLHRGPSVHRSPSALRRGASVKRAPSATRRNSKRISTIAHNGQLLLPEPASPGAQIRTIAIDEPGQAASPITSPTSPKSFLSKLTSRFRGRSKVPKVEGNHASLDLVTQGITDSLTAAPSASSLAPASPAPKSPSLRSPSPGSRVTFVDTLELAKPETETSNYVAESGLQTKPDSPSVTQKGSTELAPVIVDENGEEDGEWVDAEDDEDSEPRKFVGIKLDHTVDPLSKGAVHESPQYSEDLGTSVISLQGGPLATGVPSKPLTEDQPNSGIQSGSSQTPLLGGLSQDTPGPDSRISQWLADTPLVQLHDEAPLGLVDNGEVSSSASTPAKRESRRPRPPQIIVPTLASNNPYRVPLPPSPAGPPSTVSEVNPFRSLMPTNVGLATDTLNAEEVVPPPSPSILLTPALEVNGFDLSPGRKSSDTLAVDYAHIPLPPSPSPSSMTASRNSEDASPTTDNVTIARANSMSTLGGRSLSTAPSTRGPTTPTSMRFPGHPAMAHFSFGGPSSPSLNVEDWEAGEEERRGRSLEVQDDKRQMRSVSPKLDAVLEGDESRRSSKASFEIKEPGLNSEEKSALPLIEENVAFGKKTANDSDSENEDECGFYAFAERQLEEDKKVTDARQASAPKRSKTMSFLNVGFGKRKSTVGEPQSPPSSMPRSSTSSRLLALPGSGPKRSSTLMAPPTGGNRISRLMPSQRSSTLLAEPLSPREAVSPTMYTAGDIQSEAGKIEDEESRRLCEAAFMF